MRELLKSGVFKFNKHDLMEQGLEDQFEIMQDDQDSWGTDNSMDNFLNSDQEEDDEISRTRIIESSSDDEDSLIAVNNSTQRHASNDVLSSKLKSTIGSILNEERGRAESNFSEDTMQYKKQIETLGKQKISEKQLEKIEHIKNLNKTYDRNIIPVHNQLYLAQDMFLL